CDGRPEVTLDLSGLATPMVAGAPLPDGTILRAAWERAGDGLTLRIDHDLTCLDDDQAVRVAGYHVTALRLLADDPGARHDRQCLLSDSEIETQLYGLAGPR